MSEDKINCESFNIRSFTDDEIGEINSYVSSQIPASVLSQTYTLSEIPIEKCQVFCAIYRILDGIKGFCSKQETYDKINLQLSLCKDIYLKLFESLNLYNGNKNEILKSHYLNQILKIMHDDKKNKIVNDLINNFIVYAEKQELIPMESVTGLDLSKDHGKNLYEQVASKV